MIYLDWAATSIPHEDIILSACKKACVEFANPSSKHFKGLAAKTLLENARNDISLCLNVKPETIFFTSGGTESDHLPLLSVMSAQRQCSIAISNLEHSALSEQTKALERRGYKILTIPSDNKGFIRPEAVLKTVQEDTAFISVMAVNNEIGSIQPIEEIGQAVSEYCKGKKQIHFHTDAVQAIGKIPFNLSSLPIHSAAFSGHKIGAMHGIGFLYLNKPIEPFIKGGGHEKGIRPGTENLAGAISLAECLKLHINKKQYEAASKLMSFLIEELTKTKGIEIVPKTRIQNPASFSPWILQFSCSSLTGEVLVRCLSEKGICISTGSACSIKKNSRPILDAIKADPKTKLNSVRVSIGYKTTIEELKEFILALNSVIKEF